MSNKKFAQAQELIEEAMGIIDSIKIKGSASKKSKEDVKLALCQALGCLSWMKKMNGNLIIQYLDDLNKDNDEQAINY